MEISRLVDEVVDRAQDGWRAFRRLQIGQQVLTIGVLVAGVAVLVWAGIQIYAHLATIIVLVLVLATIMILIRSRQSSSHAPMVIDGDVLVWQYRSQRDFQQDAARLAQQGFVVSSVVDQQQRAGCTRILLLGFFALLWRPPGRLLVTYHRKR